jgi:hypothetical protein
MRDAKKGISASQFDRHIGMTYKTAWYLVHRIRKAIRESKDIQLGDSGATVEIDEAYIGGGLRHHGSIFKELGKTSFPMSQCADGTLSIRMTHFAT